MNKFCFCVLILLVTCIHGISQSANEKMNAEWLLEVGIVANKSVVSDSRFSSSRYSGHVFGGALSLIYKKNKRLHALYAYYTSGNLNSDSPLNDNLSQQYFSVDYANLYRIASSSTRPFAYYAGGNLSFFYNKRKYTAFVNRDFSGESAASLSATLRVSWFLKGGLKGVSIHDEVSIPFISIVGQPAFEKESTSLYQDIPVLSFPSFTRLKNFLSLDKDISPQHKISFSYVWDYYHLITEVQTKQAQHRFGLAYCFIF